MPLGITVASLTVTGLVWAISALVNTSNDASIRIGIVFFRCYSTKSWSALFSSQRARRWAESDSLFGAALDGYRALGEQRREAWVLGSAGSTWFLAGDYARAQALHERALSLNPNLVAAWALSAFAFAFLGADRTPVALNSGGGLERYAAGRWTAAEAAGLGGKFQGPVDGGGGHAGGLAQALGGPAGGGRQEHPQVLLFEEPGEDLNNGRLAGSWPARHHEHLLGQGQCRGRRPSIC